MSDDNRSPGSYLDGFTESHAQVSNELMAAIARLAVRCRQRSSDGNIQVMDEIAAARAVCSHIVGTTEFQKWVDWQAPAHIVINTALEGGRPPERR
jgi:hypothetical protein